MDGPSSMRALGQRQRGFVATVRDMITYTIATDPDMYHYQTNNEQQKDEI